MKVRGAGGVKYMKLNITIIREHIMKKYITLFPILFAISILFVSCSQNQPSELVIKKFVEKKFPPVNQISGNILVKTTYTEIKNKWADENKKGIYYIEVEVEEHEYDFGWNDKKRQTDTIATGDSFRKIFTFRFNKKGDIWEVDEKPIDSKTIWQNGYNF